MFAKLITKCIKSRPGKIIQIFINRSCSVLRFLAVLTCPKRLVSRRMDCHPWATYNDVPSPEGDYKKCNATLQRIYTYHLLTGISTFAITMAFGLCTDMFYLNWTIPEKPADIENYKE